MSAVAAPSVFSGSTNVIAVGVLLAEFGMFRQSLLRGQVRLYAVQSALISVLADWLTGRSLGRRLTREHASQNVVSPAPAPAASAAAPQGPADRHRQLRRRPHRSG